MFQIVLLTISIDHLQNMFLETRLVFVSLQIVIFAEFKDKKSFMISCDFNVDFDGLASLVFGNDDTIGIFASGSLMFFDGSSMSVTTNPTFATIIGLVLK